MTDKPSADFTQLAADILDLWQDHLNTLASDPKAKADMAAWMEPSRQMFAAWMEKAQTAGDANAPAAPAGKPAAPHGTRGASPVAAASDERDLRLAQLAVHVAELEKRVARLEARKQSAARKAKDAS